MDEILIMLPNGFGYECACPICNTKTIFCVPMPIERFIAGLQKFQSEHKHKETDPEIMRALGDFFKEMREEVIPALVEKRKDQIWKRS